MAGILERRPAEATGRAVPAEQQCTSEVAENAPDRYVGDALTKDRSMDTRTYKPDPLAVKAAPAAPRLRSETFESMLRGFRGYCPACGKGRMFRKFLKVADACPHCGEELHHHRADDFPAYLVIVVTGHILVPIVLAVETAFAPPMALSIPLWLTASAAMCMGLLQPVKGAVVALQWQLGMHGFEDSRKIGELEPTVTLPA